MEPKFKAVAMTGIAREHLQNGNMPEALTAHANGHAQHQMFITLGNPVLLAGQTPTWVAKAQLTFATAEADWIRAVQIRAKNFSAEIAHSVAAACKRPTRDVHRPVISYCGKDDFVYLDRCPMCGSENVRLLRKDPADFRPPNIISRILSVRVCDHHLPLEISLWQAIVNANTLLGESRIELI